MENYVCFIWSWRKEKKNRSWLTGIALVKHQTNHLLHEVRLLLLLRLYAVHLLALSGCERNNEKRDPIFVFSLDRWLWIRKEKNQIKNKERKKGRSGSYHESGQLSSPIECLFAWFVASQRRNKDLDFFHLKPFRAREKRILGLPVTAFCGSLVDIEITETGIVVVVDVALIHDPFFVFICFVICRMPNKKKTVSYATTNQETHSQKRTRANKIKKHTKTTKKVWATGRIVENRAIRILGNDGQKKRNSGNMWISMNQWK